MSYSRGQCIIKKGGGGGGMLRSLTQPGFCTFCRHKVAHAKATCWLQIHSAPLAGFIHEGCKFAKHLVLSLSS